MKHDAALGELAGPARISFIVPVRNDAVRLEACLRSIRRTQESTPALVEIIVADNGSTDASADVARRFGARVFVAANACVAELRNTAARLATGEVLAFVDADHEIVPSWTSVALQTLQEANVGAAGALCSAPVEGTWVQRAYSFLRGRPEGIRDVEWLGSGNLAVWRGAFEKVGGFDTSLETCEDVDLCNRLRASGLRIVSDSRLENVHHGDPRTLRELFRGELWRGRDNLRVTFRGPLSWAALPSAMIPVLEAVMLVAVVVCALMAPRTPIAAAIVALSLLAVAGFASLKVARAARRRGRARGPDLLQAFVVACVYDMSRALALVARAPHRAKRRELVPAP
jgi:hypothetical protein